MSSHALFLLVDQNSLFVSSAANIRNLSRLRVAPALHRVPGYSVTVARDMSAQSVGIPPLAILQGWRSNGKSTHTEHAVPQLPCQTAMHGAFIDGGNILRNVFHCLTPSTCDGASVA